MILFSTQAAKEINKADCKMRGSGYFERLEMKNLVAIQFAGGHK